MTKGNINVSVENIFPLIKKFLYSDHEIFLRELISNATDATLKLKHLTSIGEIKTDYGQPKIEVKMVIEDSKVEEVIEIISSIAKTGEVGDGKIFVIDICDCVRIRTGERGDDAV